LHSAIPFRLQRVVDRLRDIFSAAPLADLPSQAVLFPDPGIVDEDLIRFRLVYRKARRQS
jgi:hypothetical protein